jgi:hypothetical protein
MVIPVKKKRGRIKAGASLGKGKKVGRLEREDGGQWSEVGGERLPR